MTKSAKIKRLSAAVAAMALGAVFAVSAGGCAHTHTFSNEWQTDQTHHWHAATCTHSGEVSGKAVHDFSETDVCGVCRYDRSTGTTPPNPTDPTPPPDITDPTDPTDPATKKYTVAFDSNGGTAIDAQSVEDGKTAFAPVAPKRAGHQFAGWYLNNAVFSFDTPVTKNITLVAKWEKLDAKIKDYGGYDESLYIEWSDGDPSQSQVQYKPHGASAWTSADAELIRPKSGESNVARADVLGLTQGNYDIKVTASDKSELSIENIAVTAYDRSGYAHFNHTEGVGAYYDDGTVKDNTLVIYVTDENKNTVDYGYVNGQRVDLTPYLYQGNTGIGWILNNRAYSAQINNFGITKLCNTYGAVAVRFIGTVNAEKGASKEDAKYSLIDGLTAHNSTENGGTVGDNGRMARIISAKNLTLEGVGEDATVYGWGFHLVNNDINYKTTGAGSNFEVRNLTFDHYPEDAIGMEGNVQEPLSQYTKAPVQRCWVHNNTFLPGYCGDPADSDKAEGDGSCDFKRGEYFTLSYNYFTDCHKTNLIGASTSNLQYNVTMHHNWWNNCGSRVPYVRNSNVHFYNNYVTTADDGSNDYVHDADGTSFIFSESNYYFNCKQITRGGIVKSWANTLYGCWGNSGTFKATETRNEAVSNSCKYRDGKDLSHFECDPTMFYYNAQTGESDCLLDDSITARLKVMQFAGVAGWYENNPKKQSSMPFKANPIRNIPTSSVPVPDSGELAIKMPEDKNGATVSGVLFANLTGIPVKGVSVKGKGQIISFTLSAEAEVSFKAEAASPDYLAEIIDANGAVHASKVGAASVVLPAGTYSISSGTGTRTGSNAKEVTVSSLTFRSTSASAQAKIDNLNAAIDALPSTITAESGALINAATAALSALNATELENYKTQYADRWTKYRNALTAYSLAQIADVEAKIDAIGAVGENSYPAITAARAAYDALTPEQKQSVQNYTKLTAAEAAWANIAVTSVTNAISALTDVSGWTAENGKQAVTAQISAYQSVKNAYDALTSAQQSEVTNRDKLASGLEKLNTILAEIETAEKEAAALAEFEAALNNVTDATSLTKAECKAIIDLYAKLSPAKQAEYAENATYKAVLEKYTEYASLSVVAIFTSDNPALATDAGFTVSGKYNSKASFEYNGTTYKGPLKLESATTVSFTNAIANKITIKIGTAGGQIKLDGTTYKDEDNDGLIVIDSLAAGDHQITKASGDPNLCYIELEPAA